MTNIIKLCGVLFMFAKVAIAENIIEAKSAMEVFKIVKIFPKDTIIFLDVDDTLITPKSAACQGFPNSIIDDIKRDKDKYPNFTEILSNWRLQRKIILLDAKWPEIILGLKEKHRVYALTKMDSGGFGNIKSMEDWRYHELKSLQLEFTNNIENKHDAEGIPVFYKGIFLTGNFSKAATIESYNSQLKTSRIVLVDDRLDHLEDVKQYCKKYSIDFTGIIYKGLENISGQVDLDLAKFQKEYLIKHTKWLEDDEALKII
jgi:hypothetical protein